MTTPNRAIGVDAAEPPVWEPATYAETADTAGTGTAAVETAAGPNPGPAGATRPKSQLRAPAGRSNSVTNLLLVAALIAVGGIAFAVGHATTSGSSNVTAQNGNPNGGFVPGASGLPGDGLRAGFGGAASISGTVVSVGTDSITLQLAGGQTVTIATGSTTTYHNQTSGSSSDVAVGQTVQVQTAGGDGGAPNASASPGTGTTRTATDVTVTAK
jgi:hypothetical protein